MHAAISKAYQNIKTPQHPSQPIPAGASSIAGGLIAFIVVLVVIEVVLFIWAVYALYRFWRLLPTVAAVASLILVVFGFAPFSLLVTYAAKA